MGMADDLVAAAIFFAMDEGDKRAIRNLPEAQRSDPVRVLQKLDGMYAKA